MILPSRFGTIDQIPTRQLIPLKALKIQFPKLFVLIGK